MSNPREEWKQSAREGRLPRFTGVNASAADWNVEPVRLTVEQLADLDATVFADRIGYDELRRKIGDPF